jgi:hypothetical protein
MDSTEKLLEFIVITIIVIKVFYFITILCHFLFLHLPMDKLNINVEYLDNMAVYINKRLEFIYFLAMSVLLIFIFNPHYRNQKYITKHMGLLFYLFGFIIILTVNWKMFMNDVFGTHYNF